MVGLILTESVWHSRHHHYAGLPWGFFSGRIGDGHVSPRNQPLGSGNHWIRLQRRISGLLALEYKVSATLRTDPDLVRINASSVGRLRATPGALHALRKRANQRSADPRSAGTVAGGPQSSWRAPLRSQPSPERSIACFSRQGTAVCRAPIIMVTQLTRAAVGSAISCTAVLASASAFPAGSGCWRGPFASFVGLRRIRQWFLRRNSTT